MPVPSLAGRRLAGVPLLLALPLVVALPGVSMFALYTYTGNPVLQFMSVTEERIVESDQDYATGSPHVLVRIFWRGPSGGYQTPEAVEHALREAFFVKGVELRVTVVPPDEAGADARGTTLDLRAGQSVFGPVTPSEAARRVQPATHAARMAFDARGTTQESNWWE